MKPVKKQNILFDLFKKIIKFFLDVFSVCSLKIIEKPFTLRGQILKVKVFTKGFLFYGELIHHKVHS